jgi:hypothetical protein
MWQVLIDGENSWIYCGSDCKQCINWNNEMRLQEFCTLLPLVYLFLREGVPVQQLALRFEWNILYCQKETSGVKIIAYFR